MSDIAMHKSQPLFGGAAPASSAAPPVRGHLGVAVHADPRDAHAHWRDLAALGTAAPYQSPEWATAWLDTVGAASGVIPMLTVATDVDGLPTALLPLCVRRRGGLVVAEFIGGRDSNFNMGLFRPGVAWTRREIRALLSSAAVASGLRVDVFAFRNQPLAWRGAPNPLAALARRASPSFALKAEIGADAEAYLLGRLSRDGRKKLRQKANRLRAFGPVSVVEATDPGGASAILDAFVAQRGARNAAIGVRGDDLAILRAFLDRTVGAGGPVSFFGLRCGERIVATLGGVTGGDRFSGMLTSFLADEDVARTSPGELLLVEVLRLQCGAGVRTFDLGVGEARYKETFCPDAEPLFDSLVPLTFRGGLYAAAETLRLTVKRSIKQSSWAWPLALRLRRASRPLMRRRDGGVDRRL